MHCSSWNRHYSQVVLLTPPCAAVWALFLPLFGIHLQLVLDNLLIWGGEFTLRAFTYKLLLFRVQQIGSIFCQVQPDSCLGLGEAACHIGVPPGELSTWLWLSPLCCHAVPSLSSSTRPCAIHNRGSNRSPTMPVYRWFLQIMNIIYDIVLQILANCLWCAGRFFSDLWSGVGVRQWCADPSIGVSGFLTAGPLESWGKQSKTNFIRSLEAQALSEITVIFCLILISVSSLHFKNNKGGKFSLLSRKWFSYWRTPA